MRSLPLAACCLVALSLESRAEPLIREGDTWRYYKGLSSPPDQGGLNWTRVTFDDSGWGSPSPTPFGYGDSDDATVFADMQNSYVSVFLRRAFVVADTSLVTRLTLAADFDDGFVAYLNGQEIWRENMPTGNVTHATEALGNHESSRATDGTGNEKAYFEIPVGALTNGTNVLAVSGHNQSLSSSDFTLSVELHANVGLVRGPFLQMPASNKAVVVWRTTALTDSRVDWGSDTNYAGGSVIDTNGVRQHEVALTNLPAGSTVFYRVWSGGIVLDEGASFRTPAPTGQTFRFAVIGDFGQIANLPVVTSVAARINATNVDLLATVGDNIYDYGQPGYYDPVWFQPYAATMRRSVTFPSVGNHDIRLSNLKWFTNSFVLPENGPSGQRESVYSYDWGDVHFAVIDSNPVDNSDAATTQAMVGWLTNDLAHAARAWKVVIFHHPPFTSQGVHSENSRMQAAIVPVLEQYGVHVVLQGHNHFYERINPIGGVSYFTSGGGGNGLYNFATAPPAYSAYRNNSIHSFMIVEVDGLRMDLRAYDRLGNEMDRRVIDRGAPFVIDGRLDSGAWGRATNGLVIHAAIRSNLLYLATQDAGEGGDNFVLLAEAAGTTRPAPWAKTGTTMQWSALLADENDHGYAKWFDAAEQPQSDWTTFAALTPGVNNNGTAGDGALEGVVQLNALFGHFPTQLLVCAAPYGNADGGPLLPASQCPANNGDGDISSDEFLKLDPRTIALDLPVATASVAQVTNEAGLAVALLGGATVPSGFLPAWQWTQRSGLPGQLTDGNTSNAFFQLTNAVTAPTNVLLILRVNDTRFDATATLELVFVAPLDSDADGLTDQEESTGSDNVLTRANPAGRVTNPFSADSDQDGINDGDEAVAGTDPQDPAEFLGIRTAAITPAGIVITWPSVSNRSYSVLSGTNLLQPPTAVASNLPATPTVNIFTSPAAPLQFLRLRVEP